MIKDNARVESAWSRGLRFTLIGLLAGTLGGFGFALPLWLVGGQHFGAGGAMRALVIGFPLGGLIGGALIGFVFREGIGGLIQYGFEGARGRTRSEYSQIETLVIRGAYRDAVAAYEAVAAEDPGDPEPLVRGARVLRDHLGEAAAAADWLRRARQVPRLTQQQDIAIIRELVELYETRLETPGKALPELARFAQTHAGTKAAEWADSTMRRIRAGLWQDVTAEREE